MLRNKKLKNLFFYLLLLVLLLGANFVWALEINYPPVPGAIPPQDFVGTAPPEDIPSLYVKYIFHLAIWAAGVIAFGVLVYGGMLFLMSTGKPERMTAAKDQISAAFFGLLILFSSWLLLNTISPQFTLFKIPTPEEIEVIQIPETSPPPMGELQSSISTEIPFGTIIESFIFEGTRPWEEGKRIPRIKKNAEDTLSIAEKLKDQNEDLKNTTRGCSCGQAKPQCTRCARCNQCLECFTCQMCATCEGCSESLLLPQSLCTGGAGCLVCGGGGGSPFQCNLCSAAARCSGGCIGCSLCQNCLKCSDCKNCSDCSGGFPCTSDPCRNVRSRIENLEQKNFDEIENLKQEIKKSQNEIKLITVEIKRLERAERFMIEECYLRNLSGLSDYLSTKSYYLGKGWLPEAFVEKRFWEDMTKIKDDWATFYCHVSGTLWGEKKPEPSTKKTEPSYVALAEGEEVITCSKEIPIGEIIDRAERIGYKLVERLEKLIELDKEMISAVDEMHVLVSKCSSRNCVSICIPTLHGCRKYCTGQPCPTTEIENQLKKITTILEGKPIGLSNSAKEREGIRDVVYGSKKPNPNREETLREQIGIVTIINEVIPKLLQDLDIKIRAQMKTCVTPFIEQVETLEDIPINEMLDCKSSVGYIGPDRKTIKDCCYEQDWYKEYLTDCYLERGYEEYKKCLKDCLNKKAQESGIEEIAECYHLVNFLCCSF